MNIDRLKLLTKKYSIIKSALYPAIIMRRSFLKKRLLSQKEVINSFSELLLGDPVISVKEFDGVFAVDARSDLFFRMIVYKSYEPHLAKYCLKYLDKNKDVIDVGANIGFFTVMFANNIHNRKVLSIEPTKNAIKRLRRNIELNDVASKVDVFEGVASNQAGTIEIKTIEGKEEYSSLGKMKHHSISKESYMSEKVISVTLDELVKQKSLDPGFIKVDVEGAEHLVFEGSHKVLEDKRPIILSELSNFLLNENGSSSIEVINAIKKHDYDVFDPIDPSVQPGTKDFGDILCFPREMGIKINARIQI
jgi:FkbM family methyltransferase